MYSTSAMKPKIKKDEKKMNVRKIKTCLRESYKNELKEAINYMVDVKSAEIADKVKKDYSEITYNPIYEDGEEIADNHYEIGSKIDWELLIKFAKMKMELERIKAEVTE